MEYIEMANVTELDVIDNILDDTGIYNVIPRTAAISATYHRMMHTFTDGTTTAATTTTTDERSDRLYTSFLASMDDDEDEEDHEDDSSNEDDSVAVRGILV